MGLTERASSMGRRNVFDVSRTMSQVAYCFAYLLAEKDRHCLQCSVSMVHKQENHRARTIFESVISGL